MRFFILFFAICMLTVGCSSHKGSSSLSTSSKSSSSSRTSPQVRSSSSSSDKSAAIKASKEAEAEASKEAMASSAAASGLAESGREREAQDAKRARESAERATAANSAERAKASEAVVVKEEKVTIVEGEGAGSSDSGSCYHIIIGSFKQLSNARQLCQDALKNNFLPSIMENEDGLYRVSIYSSTTESSARQRLADIREKFPEYVGTWLLKEKR